MYKVVNTFTGWEDAKKFDNYEDAYTRMEEIQSEYHKDWIRTTNLPLSVIPAQKIWDFNELSNKFMWLD